jgi:D-alanyl-D-alanine carboxypeptidase (penicillin-binding protein 5/6)
MARLDLQRSSENPVAIFLLVSFVMFAILFIAAQATSGGNPRSQGGNDSQPEGTPAGGGSATEMLADAPSTTLAVEAPAPPAPPPAPAPAAPAVPAPPAASPVLVPTAPAPPVSATAYAVIERSCGALDYGFNEHQRLAPASLTKIVTSLLVAQNANLDDVVDITVSGSQMRKQGSSVMGIEPGQRYSMRDLLYGLLLPSGNDAAVAIAQYLGGGDVNRFVEMMNQQAAALGMADSHFSNPHGLDADDLYSSAYDMAVAGRAALDTPLLFDVSNTRSWVTATGLSFRNGNKLLGTYPGADGVKIGFTTNAKQTIVAAAERDGRSLIISVFGSEDRYADSRALLDWAFDHVPSHC